MTITAIRGNDNNKLKMWESSSLAVYATAGSINSMSDDVVTMTKGRKNSCLMTRGTSQWSLTILLFVIVSLFMSQHQVTGDSVYIRSGDFGQLVTSSSSRWFKGIAKDPLMLKKPSGITGVICRVFHTSKFKVFLILTNGTSHKKLV